jgi:hypothetical protein
LKPRAAFFKARRAPAAAAASLDPLFFTKMFGRTSSLLPVAAAASIDPPFLGRPRLGLWPPLLQSHRPAASKREHAIYSSVGLDLQPTPTGCGVPAEPAGAAAAARI